MKIIRRTFAEIALCGAMFGLAGNSAQAAVITFEGGLAPVFTTSDVAYVATPVASGSGYDNVAAFTGSVWVAYDENAVSPASFFLNHVDSNATFTLNSFVIAGAWGSQTLGIKGYNNGVQLFSTTHFVALAATVFSPGWAGIDQFEITTGSDYMNLAPQGSVFDGSAPHWALDNVDMQVSAVPEPETYAMMLAGLGLLGFAARRRKARQSV